MIKMTQLQVWINQKIIIDKLVAYQIVQMEELQKRLTVSIQGQGDKYKSGKRNIQVMKKRKIFYFLFYILIYRKNAYVV